MNKQLCTTDITTCQKYKNKMTTNIAITKLVIATSKIEALTPSKTEIKQKISSKSKRKQQRKKHVKKRVIRACNSKANLVNGILHSKTKNKFSVVNFLNNKLINQKTN